MRSFLCAPYYMVWRSKPRTNQFIGPSNGAKRLQSLIDAIQTARDVIKYTIYFHSDIDVHCLFINKQHVCFGIKSQWSGVFALSHFSHATHARWMLIYRSLKWKKHWNNKIKPIFISALCITTYCECKVFCHFKCDVQLYSNSVVNSVEKL